MPETKRRRVTVTISEDKEKDVGKKKNRRNDPIKEAARVILLFIVLYLIYQLFLASGGHVPR